MKNLKLFILAGALMCFAAACQNTTNRTGTTGTNSENETDQPVAKANYTCPMHPEVTSDHPGECPKCGMDLVASDSVGAAGSDTLAL